MKNILRVVEDGIPLLRARSHALAEVVEHSMGTKAKDRKTLFDSAVAILLIALVVWVSLDPFRADALPVNTAVYDEEVAKEEILWFARALYSESKIPQEQLLVAWVIRNRVESNKYPDTYKGVVRAKRQFSGLNPGDKQYWINTSLDYSDSGPGWDSALEIADAVYHASGMLRPIGLNVFHFYSPHSVTRDPSWAEGVKPVHTVRDSKTFAVRFAFYENID